MPKQFPSGFLVAVLLTASGLLWAVMFFGPLAHLVAECTAAHLQPKGNKNAYKHGRYTNEAIQERRTLRALLKAFRNNLATV
jgi:hypothetical protein